MVGKRQDSLPLLRQLQLRFHLTAMVLHQRMEMSAKETKLHKINHKIAVQHYFFFMCARSNTSLVYTYKMYTFIILRC